MKTQKPRFCRHAVNKAKHAMKLKKRNTVIVSAMALALVGSFLAMPKGGDNFEGSIISPELHSSADAYAVCKDEVVSLYLDMDNVEQITKVTIESEIDPEKFELVEFLSNADWNEVSSSYQENTGLVSYELTPIESDYSLSLGTLILHVKDSSSLQVDIEMESYGKSLEVTRGVSFITKDCE